MCSDLFDYRCDFWFLHHLSVISHDWWSSGSWDGFMQFVQCEQSGEITLFLATTVLTPILFLTKTLHRNVFGFQLLLSSAAVNCLGFKISINCVTGSGCVTCFRVIVCTWVMCPQSLLRLHHRYGETAHVGTLWLITVTQSPLSACTGNTHTGVALNTARTSHTVYTQGCAACEGGGSSAGVAAPQISAFVFTSEPSRRLLCALGLR